MCIANYVILQSYRNTVLKNRIVLKFLAPLSTKVSTYSDRSKQKVKSQSTGHQKTCIAGKVYTMINRITMRNVNLQY